MIATNEIETNETPEPNEPAPAKKPISEAKLLANRRNGALSHGPVTAEGRRRSSLNAYRNGLNGQIVCSSPEELAAFKSFCSEIQTELAPVGAIERFYAKSISENMYRLERARSLEMGMFSNGHRDHVDEMQSGHPEADTALAASRTFLEQAHEFHLLTGYEVKILRALEKHQAHLKALQDARKAAHEIAVEQPRNSSNWLKPWKKPTSRVKTSCPRPRTVGSFFLRPKSIASACAPRTFAPPGSTIFRANCRKAAPNRMTKPNFAPHNRLP